MMHRTASFALAVLAIVAVFVLPPAAQANTLIGPILPYFGPAQSPFTGLPFTYFYYEDFETGSITVPGVTAGGGGIIGPGPLVDSVEGINNGHDYFSICGACGVTFTFDASALGGHLPTHVGIVWTDGDGPNRYFRAYDSSNNLIGQIIDSSPLFFSSGGDSDANNYRFFGVTDPAGISSIFIGNDGGGIEVDDLQFGYLATTPEPGSVVLLVVGFTGVWIRRYKR